MEHNLQRGRLSGAGREAVLGSDWLIIKCMPRLLLSSSVLHGTWFLTGLFLVSVSDWLLMVVGGDLVLVQRAGTQLEHQGVFFFNTVFHKEEEQD